MRARCPDGREEPVLLVTAATRDGAAVALPPAELEGFGSIVCLGMLMGRRAESALQLWLCRDDG